MAQLFVENLTVMDFSFLDRERGVVGESWIVDIELIGELDEQGMVFDFGHVKKQVKQFVDAQADHRLLVPVASPGCNTSLDGDRLTVEFPLAGGGVVVHQSPPDAVLLIPSAVIDADEIAAELQKELQGVLPDNVTGVLIQLRPEAISDAYYHYSHGLQKHLGQCQRIAHGHRSRIQIEIDGVRNDALEAQWAQRLADSYIATESHVVETFEHEGIEHTRLKYTAQQGEFLLSLPSRYVYTMPAVSTVENIAIHLAQAVASNEAGKVVVKAFEGVGKGARGSA